MMSSTNPFPHFASPPISFLDYEKYNLSITHNNNNNNNPFQDSFEELQQQYSEDYHHHVFESEVSPTKKRKTPRKDNHSKIHTAQGPRDRRVRLSIEVARKFFYLQDLLGFDKASKTLDWLFNKSRIEIDKLVKGKKHSSSSSTVTDQSDQVGFLETLMGGSDEEDKGQKKKSSAPKCAEGSKRKKTIRRYKSGFVNQSRAEARARARERTREKLRNRLMLDDDSKKKVVGDFCCPASPSSSTLQPSFWGAIELENGYNDRIAELIMVQKMSMPPSMLYCYQQNLAVSNNSSSMFTSLPDFTVVHEQQGDSASI
ncbi:hypothetical protein L6452_41365 [Arctium lappa]|uniref:Uncharacterized protein n=1 Tax=Arctium lappa TaxID=4217 RepID=A0ACB8XNW7_ARCLA|nr:hypothetical protein L6452_41365 [Arctium lappa]